MTRTYHMPAVADRAEFDRALPRLPRAEIDHFPWDGAPHPRSYGVVAAGPRALHVFLRTDETEIRAVQTEHNSPVYTDSCLEFFLLPTPDSELYVNVEVNPRGTLLFGVGKSREARRLIGPADTALLHLEAAVRPARFGGTGWNIRYDLPFALLQRLVPAFDPAAPLRMRGNFYKCGDGLSRPHWGMWSPISAPKPDFHRPGQFGHIVSP